MALWHARGLHPAALSGAADMREGARFQSAMSALLHVPPTEQKRSGPGTHSSTMHGKEMLANCWAHGRPPCLHCAHKALWARTMKGVPIAVRDDLL